MNKVLVILGLAFAGFCFVAFMVAMTVMGIYNGMVTSRENVTGQWAEVETQYQRRYDLIPGLVEATKGVLRQEQTVFKDIADARTHYAGTSAGSPERVAATGQVESALSRLLVVMENYPTLKSDQTVQKFMDELAGTENRISVARDRYNGVVKLYNISIKTFPESILAGMFGFTEMPFFESDDNADKAVPVNFDLNTTAAPEATPEAVPAQ